MEEVTMQNIQITTAKKTFLVLISGIISIIVVLASSYLFAHHPNINVSTYTTNAQLPAAHRSQNTFSPQELQPFQGQWYMHGGLLTIQNDGRATFIARAYQNCGSGIKQPCDTWQGDRIIPGIREEITITSIQGETAYGTIVNSSDNSTGQPATIKIQPQNTLLFNKRSLCGPHAPVGYCGA
jgi:hypothetical protein